MTEKFERKTLEELCAMPDGATEAMSEEEVWFHTKNNLSEEKYKVLRDAHAMMSAWVASDDCEDRLREIWNNTHISHQIMKAHKAYPALTLRQAFVDLRNSIE